MRSRRYMAAASALAVAVAVSGCTPGGDGATEGASPDPVSGRGSAESRWTRVELPAEAMLSSARVQFSAVVAGAGPLPHMVAGVAAKPGKPDRVRVWTSEDARDWEASDVPLRDGAHAVVAAAVSDGEATVLAGSTWTVEEGIRPYALRSDDRVDWGDVELPPQAAERAVDVQAAHLGAGGALVLLGMDGDERPVAVRAGDGGEVVDLPIPDDDMEVVELVGAAGDGDTLVALAHVESPAVPSHPVMYSSADAGATWDLIDGPTEDAATAAGVVHAGDDEGFVVTGAVEDENANEIAAAWTTDGHGWLTKEQASAGLGDPHSSRLGAPAVDGDRVVAARYGSDQVLRAALMDRRGGWSVQGRADRWISPGGDHLVAPLGDGSVLMARSDRNSGTIGVMSADGAFTTSANFARADDVGLRWRQLGLDGGNPALIGAVERFDVKNGGGWTITYEISRFAFTDDATITEATQGLPPKTDDLIQLRVISDDAGATAVLGGEALPGDDVLGWFRASPDDVWTPVDGLAGPRAEDLIEAFWFDDQWIALGLDRESADVGRSDGRAAVWTSTDGMTWTRQEGPFQTSSLATGACQLPGGAGTLVVGLADDDAARAIPMAWRQTDDGWTRVDQAALGDGNGQVDSCAVRDDIAVLQGSYQGRDVLWRTADGEAFERVALGERGETFETVRALESGLVAAGTRDVGGDRGAVVWLSGDGERWHAIPVPSNRPLEGMDVLDWDGRLVVAATSDAGPDVWVLENPDELLAASDGGS